MITEERITQEQTTQGIQTEAMPDKDSYMQRILSLDEKSQAFLDGYLFAKVTDAAARQKGA